MNWFFMLSHLISIARFYFIDWRHTWNNIFFLIFQIMSTRLLFKIYWNWLYASEKRFFFPKYNVFTLIPIQNSIFRTSCGKKIFFLARNFISYISVLKNMFINFRIYRTNRLCKFATYAFHQYGKIYSIWIVFIFIFTKFLIIIFYWNQFIDSKLFRMSDWKKKQDLKWSIPLIQRNFECIICMNMKDT